MILKSTQGVVMECKYFGECGSCILYESEYLKQVTKKSETVSSLLKPFYDKPLESHISPDSHYRARAEFRVWHDKDNISYAMGNINKNGIVKIDSCPKVIKPIYNMMIPLIELLNSSYILSHKLFTVEFLSATTGDIVVTLIYHKKLDKEWIKEAKSLEEKLNISIIGRSRKQKIVISKEYVTEKLTINNKEYSYYHYEGGFTQPNPYINTKMIQWAEDRAKDIGGDLAEAYCGLGNFTIPLSKEFDKVLATEISKRSIFNANKNCELNNINNIKFARLSSAEMTQALNGVRNFRRLESIDIDNYNFSTILVDPPRAGLDNDTINLASSIENIIYISCNPYTLTKDLESLSSTHQVVTATIFDQFPYTNHIESGIFLKKIK